MVADLEVSNELLDDCFPCNEALDEDIGRFQVVWSDVLLDERLVSGYS